LSITQVEVINQRITASPLPFSADGSADSDPIQVRNIEGLGPVNAVINTVQYGSVDGESFQGSVMGKRNIVLTVGLNPNWANQTPELLRSYLYQYLMPKSKVTLRFTSTHMPVVLIDGYVETFTPNIFAKDPEYQVSIICPQPAFVAEQGTAWLGNTQAFADSSVTNVNYEGTLPAGFTLFVHANAAVPTATGEFRVIIKNPDTGFFVANPVTIDSTHDLVMSTVSGDKYLRSVNPSTQAFTSVLGKVASGSPWTQFENGLNTLQVFHATPGQDWMLQYTALYGGI